MVVGDCGIDLQYNRDVVVPLDLTLVHGLRLLDVILHVELVEDEKEHVAPLRVVVGFKARL